MDKLTLLLKQFILHFDYVLPKKLLLFARTSEFSELKYTLIDSNKNAFRKTFLKKAFFLRR